MAEVSKSPKLCEWKCDFDEFVRCSVDAQGEDDSIWLDTMVGEHSRAVVEEAFANLFTYTLPQYFKCSGRLSPDDEFKTLRVVDGDHSDEIGIDCPALIRKFGDQLIQNEIETIIKED